MVLCSWRGTVASQSYNAFKQMKWKRLIEWHPLHHVQQIETHLGAHKQQQPITKRSRRGWWWTLLKMNEDSASKYPITQKKMPCEQTSGVPLSEEQHLRIQTEHQAKRPWKSRRPPDHLPTDKTILQWKTDKQKQGTKINRCFQIFKESLHDMAQHTSPLPVSLHPTLPD